MPAGITWIGEDKDSKRFVCKVRAGTNLESYCTGELWEGMLKMASGKKKPHRCWPLAILLTKKLFSNKINF